MAQPETQQGRLPGDDADSSGWADVVNHIVSIATYRLLRSLPPAEPASDTGGRSAGEPHGNCPGSIYCVAFGTPIAPVVNDVLQALLAAVHSHAAAGAASTPSHQDASRPSLLLAVNGVRLGCGSGGVHTQDDTTQAQQPSLVSSRCPALHGDGGRREEHRVVYRGAVTRTGGPLVVTPRTVSSARSPSRDGNHAAEPNAAGLASEVLRAINGLLQVEATTVAASSCGQHDGGSGGVLCTLSLSLATPMQGHTTSFSGDGSSVGVDVAATSIDIHFMPGAQTDAGRVGNSGATAPQEEEEDVLLLPQAAALYHAWLQANTSGCEDAAEARNKAAMFAFWRPFLMLLHPAHRDAVVVSVASARCLIELHRFQETLQRMFRSMMSVPCALLPPPHAPQSKPSSSGCCASPLHQQLDAVQVRLQALALQHRWLAALIGVAAPSALPYLLADDVDASRRHHSANGENHDGLHEAHALTSPPPKPPLGQDNGCVACPAPADTSREISLSVVQREAVGLDWREDDAASAERLGLRGAASTEPHQRSMEPSLPNTSTFVLPTSSSISEPEASAGVAPAQAARSKGVVSVFDRLLAPKGGSATATKRTSLSPSANGRKPFVGGGTAAAHVQQQQRPKAATLATAAFSTELPAQHHRQDGQQQSVTVVPANGFPEAHQQALLREQQHRFLALEQQFNETIVTLTKESEGKLIAKEREIARLVDKVAVLERAGGSGGARAAPPEIPSHNAGQNANGSSTRTSQQQEEEVAALRTAHKEADKALQRVLDDKDRLEQMIEFQRKDADSRIEFLETKVKKQREAFESELAQKKHEAADAQGIKFQRAREALEQQITSLSDQVQLLKDDKKNLVAALRSLEKARREEAQEGAATEGTGQSGGIPRERTNAVHEVNEVHAHLSELLRTARGQLKAVVEERDGLLLSASEKESQLSTTRTTVDMLRSQLARERAAGASASNVSAGKTGVDGPASAPTSTAQTILNNVQRRLSSAPHVAAATRSGSTSSPLRPGVAHYLMQQRVDPSELISPRKVPR